MNTSLNLGSPPSVLKNLKAGIFKMMIDFMKSLFPIYQNIITFLLCWKIAVRNDAVFGLGVCTKIIFIMYRNFR